MPAKLGLPEILLLLAVALLIFGPKKLPEVGRQIGRFMNEFKRASNEFKAQIESEINSIETGVKTEILPPIHAPLNSLANRIFNPPPAERLRAAEVADAPDTESTPVPEPPASKVAPDA